METKKATEVTGCNTCKKGLSETQKWVLALSMYMFITSIYGTIVLIKNIVDLF
jgi:hypothetical protein